MTRAAPRRRTRAEALDRQLMSPKEFADEMGIARSTLYRWLETGEIKSSKISGRRFIPTSEIDRIVREAS